MKRVQAAKSVVSPAVVALLLASAFFFWLWYERYLRFEFNELGRYYDAADQVVYTDAGFIWGLPAFGCLFAAVATVAVRLWRRRGHPAFE